MLRAEFRPEQLTALVDTREQIPLDLSPLRTVRKTLPTGDYSVLGLESVVAVERKSLADLVASAGAQRGRFEREVKRLLAYPVRALVVEATWEDLEAGQWRSETPPHSVIGSVLGWISSGLPVILAGDHRRAGRFTSRLLFVSARRRWREARALGNGVSTGQSPGRAGDDPEAPRAAEAGKAKTGPNEEERSGNNSSREE